MDTGRLLWALRRLRSMPPAELPHRLREAARKRQDRSGAWLGEVDAGVERHLAAPPPGWPVAQWGLGEGLAGRDGSSLDEDVEAVVSGAFTMLGRSWSPERRRAWGWDPETEETWPQDRFAWDVDFRHEAGTKDVKAGWELLRLQHLQLLAVAAHGGHEAAREAVLADLEHYLSTCVPGQGIAWASGIEVAQRVVSLLLISGLLGPASLPTALRASLWRELAASGVWLARYPSLYSSANNHRVAELGGLWLLSCLAPSLPWARAWRREAAAGLAREAVLQLHTDGVGDEQTPTYQAYSVEWLLVCRVLGRSVGRELPPEVDDRLASSARFLGTLLGPGGVHPRFGDEDEGVVIRRCLGPEDHVRSVVGAVACWLGRGALVPQGWEADLRSGLLALEPPPGGPAARTSRHFPEGGYTWLHGEDAQGGLTEVLVDHGPLGFKWTAGHGHADALAIWVRRQGVPLIVDSGTYRYNGQPAWRTWMRGTAAHNTVQVDGAEQSDQAGPFNWGRRAACALEELALEPGGGGGRVQARHDGFVPLGVLHRREVRLEGAGRLVVRDHLEGAGEHTVAVRFLLGPEVRVQLLAQPSGPPAVVLWRGQVELGRVRGSGGQLFPVLHRQSEEAAPGVLSPAYNERVAGTCLSWSGRVTLPLEWTCEFLFSPAAPLGAGP